MLKFVQKLLVLALLQVLIPLKASALGILIPAYFSPGTRWTELNDAARRVPLIAIMNPNNGPGTSSSSSYVTAINSLRQSGGRVIGYVYSSYTARPLANVQ